MILAVLLQSPVIMYNHKSIDTIRSFLTSENQTLCVAESVTSGHLQAALSQADEASAFFQGGITAYNLGQKSRHLHVNPIHAMACNSVSPTIADEMALNAVRLFSSDWSIAITGYASPLPEAGISDLFAFYAIAFRDEIVHRDRLDGQHGDILNVQVSYTNRVLEQFGQYLARSAERKDNA